MKNREKLENSEIKILKIKQISFFFTEVRRFCSNH